MSRRKRRYAEASAMKLMSLNIGDDGTDALDDDEPSDGESEDGCGVICPECNGSGEGMHDGSRCRRCGGDGEV